MIALQGIGKSFAGHAVLRAVSVDIAPGQVTALIGPSGSGKARCCAASTCWSSPTPAA
jgi:ABC-type Fe3+/spermidine/putrescine transport system ATPase subunit